LIAAQRPTATRVAGFQTWKSLRRFVRHGEKGIAILAPIVRHPVAASADDEPAVVGFRAAYVFDVSQTDGDPLPEIAVPAGDPGVALARLRTSIVSAGIRLTDVTDLGGALGLSTGGAIDVLVELAPATEFVVLVHEYAHELLHRGADRPALRGTRELEAEAVAHIVGEATGLDVLSAARDYIHLLRGRSRSPGGVRGSHSARGRDHPERREHRVATSFAAWVAANLASILRDHREAGSISELIALWGFVDDHTFLTKAGAVGQVYRIEGVDDECLDHDDRALVARRCEQALRQLDASFRVSQYLLKRPARPFAEEPHDHPVVHQALRRRLT
jgi:hypothetical protein